MCRGKACTPSVLLVNLALLRPDCAACESGCPVPANRTVQGSAPCCLCPGRSPNANSGRNPLPSLWGQRDGWLGGALTWFTSGGCPASFCVCGLGTELRPLSELCLPCVWRRPRWAGSVRSNAPVRRPLSSADTLPPLLQPGALRSSEQWWFRGQICESVHPEQGGREGREQDGASQGLCPLCPALEEGCLQSPCAPAVSFQTPRAWRRGCPGAGLGEPCARWAHSTHM